LAPVKASVMAPEPEMASAMARVTVPEPVLAREPVPASSL
jgi:hypothetical protein